MAIKRRRLRGKKLLIVAGSIAGASILGCGDDGGATDAVVDSAADTIDVSDTAVANLLPPPDSSLDATPDATGDSAMDAAPDATDAASDGASDAASDAPTDTIMMFDAPVANLLPPPDSSSS